MAKEVHFTEVTFGENKVLVVPKGFILTPVGGDENDALKPCAHCGAGVNPFVPSCDSCGQGHPFLTFRKENESSNATSKESTNGHTPGVVKINIQEVRGAVIADSIDVENGSVVGALTAPDISLGNGVTSASIVGYKINTGRQTRANHMTLQTGSIGFASRIDTLTIAEGIGNVHIGFLTQIGTLRIDESVDFHKPLGVRIGSIERGKFSLDNQFPQVE